MQKLLINHALGVVIYLIFICGTSFSTDRYVVEPGTIENSKDVIPYNTWTNAATNIQWAMNIAVDGETVWVSNGTYNLTNQINFTNGITVRSANGREVTIVNGNYPAYTNRCFLVTNANALVQGFTITNGRGSGAGVYLRNGATVRNCIISGNTARDGNGGGVCIDAKGTVDLCSVVGNVATGKMTGGGGIYLSGGGTVTNSTIAWNLAVITNTTYYAGGGGAMLMVGGLIQNCVISSNIAQRVTGFGGGGGVMYIEAGSVINSIINGNTNSTDFRGGGVFMSSGGTLRNCMIVNNKSPLMSGGVCIYSPATVQNCTIAGNSGNNGGLSIWAYSDRLALIENCVIVSNYTFAGSLDNWVFSNNKTNIYIINTCTYPTNFPLSSSTTNYVNPSGCISNDPAFVNYPAGNYRLANNSPCVNTGTNQDWMTGAVDLDGRMRIRYGTVDMGAYEAFHNATFYRFY